ncbi:MAG: methyltransferase [Chloroflexi bacterium]|nr:methyltransferase [Chloroflexota bacterium]
MAIKPFQFKQFTIQQDRCAFKVGTDGILLGAWADVAGVERVLDIGTGSGLLALMLAQRLPLAQVDAVEIDPNSAQQAMENVQASPWAERVKVWQTAVQTHTASGTQPYDLIISNPPFFDVKSNMVAPQIGRQQARQTTMLDHNTLLDCVMALLGGNGRFCTILPVLAGALLIAYAAEKGLSCVRKTAVRPVAHKPPHRLLLQFEQTQQPMQEDELIIETAQRHHYSDEFITLTEAFYLKL